MSDVVMIGLAWIDWVAWNLGRGLLLVSAFTLGYWIGHYV